MARYLVAIHRPKGCVPAEVLDEAARAEIEAVNEAMVAAGVRVFVGGLRPVEQGKALRRGEGGAVTVSGGPYLDAGEFVDGFWVLEVKDEAEAVAWGRRAAAACRAGVEVRPFY